MWKLNNGYLPPSLSSNFKPHTTTLRSQHATPAPRTDHAFRFISYSGVKLWNNEIPLKIKKINTYKAFSKAMHNHLLNKL